jgi:hypothetical protein
MKCEVHLIAPPSEKGDFAELLDPDREHILYRELFISIPFRVLHVSTNIGSCTVPEVDKRLPVHICSSVEQNLYI